MPDGLDDRAILEIPMGVVDEENRIGLQLSCKRERHGEVLDCIGCGLVFE